MTAPSVPSREDVAALFWPHSRDLLGWDAALMQADAVLALYAPIVEQAGKDRAAVEEFRALAKQTITTAREQAASIREALDGEVSRW